MAVPRSEYAEPQPKPFKFRPPRTSTAWVRSVQAILPLLARLDPVMVPVEVDEADLERLRRLRGKRVVLAPNHPEGIEPYILFHLSKRLCAEFNYVAAKEAFEQPQPAFRWLARLGLYMPIMQKLGVYSVVRGTSDRDCFRTTRELLVKGERWLVVFPEGEVCWRNDTVMPLQQGVAQFGFWALEDLSAAGRHPPLFFVPVAIKFMFTVDVRAHIDRSLHRLEQKLKLDPPPPGMTRYLRLRRAGEAVLAANERRYGVEPHAHDTLDERIQRVKERIIARVATALGVTQNMEQPILERIRELFNILDRNLMDVAEADAYEEQLGKLSPEEVRAFYGQLWRGLHFAAINDGYVAETLSAERFFDMLGLLEWEVFGERKPWGPRKAVVRVGEPIDLSAYLESYRKQKRVAREEVTRALESSLRQMLAEMDPRKPPIVD